MVRFVLRVFWIGCFSIALIYVTLIGSPWVAAHLFETKAPIACEYRSENLFSSAFVGSGVVLEANHAKKHAIGFKLFLESFRVSITIPYNWKYSYSNSNRKSFFGFDFWWSWTYLTQSGNHLGIFKLPNITLEDTSNSDAVIEVNKIFGYNLIPIIQYELSLPIWFIFLIAFFPTLYKFWKRRFKLRRENRCSHCEYDLTRNQSGVCPECGNPLNASRLNDGKKKSLM